MKKAFVFITILFLSISAYSTNHLNPPIKSEVATVYVYRPNNIVGFGAVYNLKVNGHKMTKIKNGKKSILKLPAGKTRFSVKGNTIEINLQPGKTYYLRSVIVRNMLLGKPDLVAVQEQFAKTELLKIK